MRQKNLRKTDRPKIERKNKNHLLWQGDTTVDKLPKVAGILPNLGLCTDPVWLETTFSRELIKKSEFANFTPEIFSLVAPTADCQVHDTSKGMCIYWKMHSCGFRLPLTDFQIELLKFLKAPPVQLTPVAWCYITSFKHLFMEFSELKDCHPSIALFFYYFALTVSSNFLTFKTKRGKVSPIFILESGKGQVLSKVYS